MSSKANGRRSEERCESYGENKLMMIFNKSKEIIKKFMENFKNIIATQKMKRRRLYTICEKSKSSTFLN
jgi:hypothetical protein